MGFLIVDIGQRERALLVINGEARRYLTPGRFRVFRPFAKLEVVRLSASTLLVDLPAESVALIPSQDLQLIRVGPGERAVVYKRGRPALWLGTGEHQLLTLERTPAGPGRAEEPALRVERLDVSGVETLPLRDELKALVPSSDYVEATAASGSVVLRFVDGALDRVLPAGRHAAWTVERKVSLAVIDLRERLLQVTGQEVMTKDRVTLRLNLAASFRVVDAARLATVARTPDDLFYLAMQLAARDAVASRTLDELLASREVLAEELSGVVKVKVAELGLELLRFGIKDLILPGEMKALLNRVIQAQKEAEANVILRREETAATRSMAQTARVLAENPLLIRLKELEAYKEVAEKVGRLHVVIGEGQLPSLKV